LLLFLSISVPGLVLCTNCQALIDTGTTYIGGPTNIINSFHQMIGATLNSQTGQYVVSCSKLNTFPGKEISFISLLNRQLLEKKIEH